MLESKEAVDWEAPGMFVERVRQSRRTLRHTFEQYSQRLVSRELAAQKTRWRKAGGRVCWHGVFFEHSRAGGCQCTQAANADWTDARFMAKSDPDLKALTVQRFVPAAWNGWASYKRECGDGTGDDTVL